jgi:hypothetical protein
MSIDLNKSHKQPMWYLEAESSRNVLVEDAHGDRGERREEDVVGRQRPVIVENLA